MVNPMGVKRIGVGAAVVNRLLYAVGGFDGVNRLNSVECYHPENDEWRMVAPMNTTRSGAGRWKIGKEWIIWYNQNVKKVIFRPKYSQKTLHRSPSWAIYGVSFVSSKSVL